MVVDTNQTCMEFGGIRPTIQQRFERFHANNPEVYVELCSLARMSGGRIIGMKMLFEVLRWNFYLKNDEQEEFKLCNDYHSRYARLIMKQEDDLTGKFRTRDLTAH